MGWVRRSLVPRGTYHYITIRPRKHDSKWPLGSQAAYGFRKNLRNSSRNWMGRVNACKVERLHVVRTTIEKVNP